MFQALPLSVSKTIEKKFLKSQGNVPQTPPALHITKWVSGTCHLGGEQDELVTYYPNFLPLLIVAANTFTGLAALGHRF